MTSNITHCINILRDTYGLEFYKRPEIGLIKYTSINNLEVTPNEVVTLIGNDNSTITKILSTRSFFIIKHEISGKVIKPTILTKCRTSHSVYTYSDIRGLIDYSLCFTDNQEHLNHFREKTNNRAINLFIKKDEANVNSWYLTDDYYTTEAGIPINKILLGFLKSEGIKMDSTRGSLVASYIIDLLDDCLSSTPALGVELRAPDWEEFLESKTGTDIPDGSGNSIIIDDITPVVSEDLIIRAKITRADSIIEIKGLPTVFETILDRDKNTLVNINTYGIIEDEINDLPVRNAIKSQYVEVRIVEVGKDCTDECFTTYRLKDSLDNVMPLTYKFEPHKEYDIILRAKGCLFLPVQPTVVDPYISGYTFTAINGSLPEMPGNKRCNVILAEHLGYSITKVGKDLFSNNTQFELIENTFSEMYELEAVDWRLFNKLSKLKVLNSIFSHCHSIKKIDERLFIKNIEITELIRVFTNCYALKELPESLLHPLEKLVSVTGLALDSGIAKLYAQFFTHNLRLKDYSHAFSNTSVYYIPVGFIPDGIEAFKSNKYVVDFTEMFSYTDIEMLEDSTLNNYYFCKLDSMFKGCTYLHKMNKPFYNVFTETKVDGVTIDLQDTFTGAYIDTDLTYVDEIMKSLFVITSGLYKEESSREWIINTSINVVPKHMDNVMNYNIRLGGTIDPNDLGDQFSNTTMFQLSLNTDFVDRTPTNRNPIEFVVDTGDLDMMPHMRIQKYSIPRNGLDKDEIILSYYYNEYCKNVDLTISTNTDLVIPNEHYMKYATNEKSHIDTLALSVSGIAPLHLDANGTQIHLNKKFEQFEYEPEFEADEYYKELPNNENPLYMYIADTVKYNNVVPLSTPKKRTKKETTK